MFAQAAHPLEKQSASSLASEYVSMHLAVEKSDCKLPLKCYTKELTPT